MLRVARLIRPDATFIEGNAETFGRTGSFDIVTCMFATHEMPPEGRLNVLRNAARIAKRAVVVLDIDPNFEGSLRKKPNEGAAFLAGEPYVLEYLKRIDADIRACTRERSWTLKRVELVPEHCVAWQLGRVKLRFKGAVGNKFAGFPGTKPKRRGNDGRSSDAAPAFGI